VFIRRQAFEDDRNSFRDVYVIELATRRPLVSLESTALQTALRPPTSAATVDTWCSHRKPAT
jgi:hypothetical protein